MVAPSPFHMLSRFQRLVILTILCADLLILGLGEFSLYRSRQQFEYRAQTQTRNIALAIVRDVSAFIDKVDLSLQMTQERVQHQIATHQVEKNSLIAALEKQKSYLPEAGEILLTDSEGVVVAHSGESQDKYITLADRAYFKALKVDDSLGLKISKPLNDTISNRYSIMLARRYNDATGHFAGIIAVSLTVNNWLKFLSSFDLGPKGLATLRHSDDLSLIARFPQAPHLAGAREGESVLSPEYRQLASSKVAFATYHAIAPADGVDRRVTLYRLLNAPIIASVGAASEDYLSDYYSQVRETAVLIIGMLLLSLLSGRALLRSFAIVEQSKVKLKESTERLSRAQQIARIGNFEWNLLTDEFTYSDELARLWGYRSGLTTLDAHTFQTGIHPEDREVFDRAAKEAVQQNNHCVQEYRVIRPDGTTHYIRALVEIAVNQENQAVHLIGTAQEIDQQKQAEFEKKRLTRALRLLGNCNLALVKTDEERSLFERICTQIVTTGGYKMAWVGLTMDEGSNFIKPISNACDGAEYSNEAIFSCESPFDIENYPGNTAIKTLTSQVEQDIHRASKIPCLVQAATQFGFESGIWLPLKVNGIAIGFLCIYANDPQAFNIDEIALLEELARNLSFGLTALRDRHEHKLADEKLKLAANVFTNAREGIMITDERGKILDVNDTFVEITGYSRDEVLGKNPRILSSGLHDRAFYSEMIDCLQNRGFWQGEIWNRRKNGEPYAEMQTISAVRDPSGEIKQFVSLFSDITPIKAHQHELEQMAHFDALTGLPNRVLLADRLRQSMSQALRQEHPLALAFLDLDGFKNVNDQFGHEVGDQLLLELARRFKQVVRDSDTIARFGGDEFVIVLPFFATADAAENLLGRLLEATAKPFELGSRSVEVTASIGLTFYPQSEEVDADQLMRQADQAMYFAKVAGKNRIHIFDAEQDRSVRGYHESLEGIRSALHAREFVLYYQPKVNMRTGQLIGAEALIRWQHPERGLLAPGVFLPIVENHPLSIELGEWVIDTALTQIANWNAQGLHIPVSVNIGARQLQQGDFVERLTHFLSSHVTVNPADLDLEILESSALEDLDRAAEVIDRCRQLGVKFSLDDFGTGYCSLSYLKRLSVDHLKIDQTFVRDMLNNPGDLAILEGVLGLAKAFRCKVIAEGVETIEHGETLLRLGCDLAQGYGVARPMPSAKIPEWAATWQKAEQWHAIAVVGPKETGVLHAEVELRAWVCALENLLKGTSDLLPKRMQRHFKNWLINEGMANFGEHHEFATLQRLHENACELTTELCKLNEAGDKSGALSQLKSLQINHAELIVCLKALYHKTG